jgi:hypothetical protein
MSPEFYAKVQRYIVNSSIDISVLRGRSRGTVEAAQSFYMRLTLPNSHSRVPFRLR